MVCTPVTFGRSICVHWILVFNDPRKHSPQAVVTTNAMIRGGIPIAIDRFQYALDCLEVDIVFGSSLPSWRELIRHNKLRAKEIFRRDLESLRQRRAEEAAQANSEQESAGKELNNETVTEEQARKEMTGKEPMEQVVAVIKEEKAGKKQKLNSDLTDISVTPHSNIANKVVSARHRNSTTPMIENTNMPCGGKVVGKQDQHSTSHQNNPGLDTRTQNNVQTSKSPPNQIRTKASDTTDSQMDDYGRFAEEFDDLYTEF